MTTLRNIRSSLAYRKLPCRPALRICLSLAGAALILTACKAPPISPNTTQTFPWPPPSPSTAMVLPHDVLFKKPGSLGDAAMKLETALNATGYVDRRYFALEGGGFVILTRLEQTDSSGTPMALPARWSTGITYDESFSPIDIIRRFITAPHGYYQVLAFVVTDQTFEFKPPPKDSGPIDGLFSKGYIALPPSVANQPVSNGSKCTVLIYAFTKQPGVGDGSAAAWMTNGVSAQDRLVKDNLLPTLQKAALEMAHDG